MKQFRVPCHFGLAGKQPFPLYVGEPNPENHPLKYQSDWLRRERGGTVPRSVLDSLKRLQQIAIRSHVSFEDLCAYAIGRGRAASGAAAKERARPAATLQEETAAKASGQAMSGPAAPAPQLPLQVIHNPDWEQRVKSQDDERTKLPHLQLVAQRAEDADTAEPVSKPARKPKPGVELQPVRRLVPTDRAELEKYPFRHLYDWLRTKPAMGFAEIQSLTAVFLPPEAEEEQLLLSTLMLEETQSVLLPHSFAETLDFLFHYEDLHYSFAVVLDAGAQYLSRSTYGNVLNLYQMNKPALEGLRHSLNACLMAFAHQKIAPERAALAPEDFNLSEFHQRCAQWFKTHPQKAR